ncbi:tRNA (adenosine(37)-N6)-dimethylallyltransferase MiaA [Candidatus Parcubacteria bacterium]|nr:tRNA (adenosine(37)-N6)-dimethylallyltransferase MiaA [Patescibacteria group bacterium]MCG2689535.1 tRNA (adenosine(37)-N6)-dimethylallyltransferase MiaA [Candidatus Parcubacteria bacterium]
MSNKLIVILGSTCTGKTSLAIKLCKELNGEIISADSRQVYKGMDIGTGKLPLRESAITYKKGEGFWTIDGIKIRCYDLVTPNQNFTVVDWAKVAKAEIESAIRRGKTPIVVGGTGFYIDVLTGRATVSGVSPNSNLRNSLQALSTDQLLEKLKALNPERIRTIDKNNPIRLMRAIEIACETKSKMNENLSYNCEPVFIGLTASRDVLYKRADSFVSNLLNLGILTEIENLVNSGYEKTRPMTSLIYSEFYNFFQRHDSLENTITKSNFDLHAYIRRQLTWFNRNPDVLWFNVCDKNLYEKVKLAIQSNYGT